MKDELGSIFEEVQKITKEVVSRYIRYGLEEVSFGQKELHFVFKRYPNDAEIRQVKSFKENGLAEVVQKILWLASEEGIECQSQYCGNNVLFKGSGGKSFIRLEIPFAMDQIILRQLVAP
jgi:hypothetical protein